MIAGVETSLPRTGRQALLHQWGKDFQFWLYITVTLQLFRLLLIAVYHEQIGARTGADSVLQVIATGLRYDVSTAGTWVAPIFLLGIAIIWFPLDRFITALRRFAVNLYAILSILIFGADLLFFGTYGDQFNQMIFGIVHDDTVAILVTIWKEYHPLLFIGITLPLILGNLWLVHRWLAYTPSWLHGLSFNPRPLLNSVALGIVMFFVMIAFVRGGTLWGEPIRLKHAFVVDDLFLNRSVINPFTALSSTLDNKLKLEKGIALKQFWPNEDINDVLRYELTRRGKSPTNDKDLDHQLERVTEGYPKAKPKHIFLLLMESHSGWTVMPIYRFAGLSPEFSALADEGIYFPNFLPAGSGTIGSMNTLVTGLPDVGLNINYETTASKTYPSALAAVMKRLGYTTRFFYGGFLGWQRLDNFAQNQGFDEVYGGGEMGAGLHTNEWGVDDQYLFNFVLQTVQADKPSFNFILSTSNHPPYDLDLEALGYHLKDELPAPLEITKEDTVKVLGHLWYADQQAGRFVRQAEKQLPDTLFAITADHTARLHITFPCGSGDEQTAVPFILYGPKVLPTSGVMEPTAGAHLDIPTTLIELAADKGFHYTSFGQNMLSKNSPSYGYGWNSLIGEDFIVKAGINKSKSDKKGKGEDKGEGKDENEDENVEQNILTLDVPRYRYNWKFIFGEDFIINEDESEDVEQNMLDKNTFRYRYNWKVIFGEDFIVCEGACRNVEEVKCEARDKNFTAYALPPEGQPQIADELNRFNSLKALSWYRVKKGNTLP